MTGRTVTDETTGATYVVPEGGSEDAETVQEEVQEVAETPQPVNDRLPEDHPLVVTMRKERDQRKQLENELSELRKQQMSESERAVLEAKEQGAAEARAQYENELSALKRQQLTSRLQIQAAKVLHDSADAAAHIDLSDLDPSDENADTEIVSRLNALIELKPYLRVSETRPSGSNDAVSRPAPSNGNHVSVGAALKALRR